MTDLVELSIAQAAEQIRDRKVSAVELVDATLRRIEATEPTLHAYALVLAESSRAAAARLDVELAEGVWRGPLHGVPIAVKDICNTAGIATESGSKVMAGFVPTYDATVVEMLSAAGAVMIGKSVTHEFAYGVNNPPTRTAYDLSCYPGGSSAGSGVAVAHRTAFGGIGTDTGGSIRVPASIEGIVGLKPTFGRVSRYGVFPLATSLDHVGPMTRTVEDCAILLQTIAGYDARDSGSIRELVPDYRVDLEAGVRGLRIGVERDYFFYEGVNAEVRALVEAVLTDLEEQGATLVDVQVPYLELMGPTGLTILLAEASTVHRRLLRTHADDYNPAVRRMFELGEFVPATHYLTAQKARGLLRNSMRQAFVGNGLDAMLWPTLPTTTTPFDMLSQPRTDGGPGTPILAFIHHTFSANVTGQPALSIPCGGTSAGMPVGVQLLGRPFGEARLFQIARAYERAHEWTTHSPPMEAFALAG